MAITADYTGRKHDLLIFQGTAPVGNRAVTTGWGDSGEIVAGVQKVAQTWIILFLTERGTVLGDEERGTDFLRAVRTGLIRVEDDVPTYFGIAADKVQRTMDLDADGQGLPDDERLDDAELTAYFIDRASSTLRLNITITAISGAGTDVVVPISVSIR